MQTNFELIEDLPVRAEYSNSLSPEAKLIVAMIIQAISDANKSFDCPVRREARCWLLSDDCAKYSELLGSRPDYFISKLRRVLDWVKPLGH